MIADLRRGEFGRTALAFAVLFFIVGSYTIVKAVRDAVFLSRFSVTELSVVSIGLAVASGAIVSVYLRKTAGISAGRLLTGTHAFIALSLLLLAAGLRQGGEGGWLAWLLYGWSSIFGVFVVAQFWLLASELFDLREAKRLFGLIAWGAVAGGLCGGLTARFLAHRLGTFGLLVLSAGLLLLGSLAARALWRRRRLEVRPSRGAMRVAAPSIWRLVREPSYLRILALGLVLATVVTTLLDWQLKTVAKQAFDSRSEALAAFFGSIQAYLSAGSLVVQVGVTPWLLHRYGVGVGRNVLPVTMLFGFAAIAGHALLSVPLLAVVTGARLVEGGTRFAIHQPATELSWLALPARERAFGKPFVDTVGDRVGTALAGVVWIAFAMFSQDGAPRVRWIAVAGAALACAWLVVLGKTQRAYVAETRAALAERSMDLDSLRRSFGDERTRHTIVEALMSGDAARIRFALYLLENAEWPMPDLGAALDHPESDVRVQALRLLAQKRCLEHRASALSAFIVGDAEVREAALVYLRLTARGDPDPVFAQAPDHDRTVRFARSLIHDDEPVTVTARAEEVVRAMEAASQEERLSMLRLMGAAHAETVARSVGALFDHPDPRVVAASIRSAGRARAVSLVPALAGKLAVRKWRAAAMSALADIGSDALKYLIGVMRSPATPDDVKRSIVRLAGASRNAQIAAELLPFLDHPSPDMADDALRALARIQARAPFGLNRRAIVARTVGEAGALARDLSFLGGGSWPVARDCDDEGDFLRSSVRDAVSVRVERVFLLLALVHRPADVQSVHRGLKSSMKATRARSIELLDNLVELDLRRVLVPVLEDADGERFGAVARRVFGLLPESRRQAIERMTTGRDAWLRQVGAWATESNGSRSMGLSLVEKALRLGTVDVLSCVGSEDLACVAELAEELELAEGTTIYSHGDAPDALYVILAGTVRLYQDKDEIGALGPGEAFGSWALFDETPRVASAISEGLVRVLKVDRESFLELLGDRVAIARAIFKAMVGRIRSLAELAPQP